ncbi:MAG TPA: hypothetical protein VGI39_37835 [Polyangiaceae bacterium]|jgi:hypothetical protein
MWLEAHIPIDDLTVLVKDLAPMTLPFGEGGEIHLFEPSQVSLVRDEGLRVQCKAHLKRSVLGMVVPVTVHDLAVIIRPLVVDTGDDEKKSDEKSEAPRLVFRFEIAHTDIAGLPDFLDHEVAVFANKALASHHIELTWNYTRTFEHAVDLPAMIQPLSSLLLGASDARLRVTDKYLLLAIQIDVEVTRRAPSRSETVIRNAADAVTPER